MLDARGGTRFGGFFSRKLDLKEFERATKLPQRTGRVIAESARLEPVWRRLGKWLSSACQSSSSIKNHFKVAQGRVSVDEALVDTFNDLKRLLASLVVLASWAPARMAPSRLLAFLVVPASCALARTAPSRLLVFLVVPASCTSARTALTRRMACRCSSAGVRCAVDKVVTALA